MQDDAQIGGRKTDDGGATSDSDLLRRYADDKSETAFAELVGRHVDPVYSAALRRVSGDANCAADVAQQVFTVLARDAAKLTRHTVLHRDAQRCDRFAAPRIPPARARTGGRQHA